MYFYKALRPQVSPFLWAIDREGIPRSWLRPGVLVNCLRPLCSICLDFTGGWWDVFGFRLEGCHILDFALCLYDCAAFVGGHPQV